MIARVRSEDGVGILERPPPPCSPASPISPSSATAWELRAAARTGRYSWNSTSAGTLKSSASWRASGSSAA